LSVRKRTPVDIYLDWMPALALALGTLVFFTGRRAFFRRTAHPAALGLQ